MMKIATLNCNGLRAALRKGLADWVSEHQPDVLCLQEIKIDRQALQQHLDAFPGYKSAWFPAEKKGYSGVGLLTKTTPEAVYYGCDADRFDQEGRVLRAELPSGLCVISLYLPSGTQGGPRQTYKEEFMAYFAEWVQRLDAYKEGRLVITGDFNICHTEKDIHDPVRLKNVSGFLPREREWFTQFLDLGLSDTFRAVTDAGGYYTWWSYRSRAKERDKGWRLDYQLVTQNLAHQVRSHELHQPINVSDHVPTLLTLED